VGLPALPSPRPAALAGALATALDESARALDAAQAWVRERVGDGERLMVPMEVRGGPPPHGDALVAARSAVLIAARWAEEVAAEPVDVSGADLSGVDIPDLGIVAGVVWTMRTDWPPCVARVVRSRSDRIAPGVYRIRGARG
jgi:hypothetical protein